MIYIRCKRDLNKVKIKRLGYVLSRSKRSLVFIFSFFLQWQGGHAFSLEEDSLFKVNPTKEEIQYGKTLFFSLENALYRAPYTARDLLSIDLNKHGDLFTSYQKITENLKDIHKQESFSTLNKKCNLALYDTFKKEIRRFCVKKFFHLLSLNKKMDKEELAEKDIFFHEHKKTIFSRALYSSRRYYKKRIKKDLLSFENPKKQKRSFNKKEYQALRKMVTDLRKDLDKNKKSKEELEEKTYAIINYFKKVKDNINPEKASILLTFLTRYLQGAPHYFLAEKVIEVLHLHTKPSQRYTVDFLSFWNLILEKEWKKATTLAHDRLLNKPHSWTEKILFWTAISYQELKKESKAKGIYHDIIEKWPLSYYAIVSLKQLRSMDKREENSDEVKDFIEKKLEKNQKFITSRPIFSPQIEKTWKRMKILSLIHSRKFLRHEQREILSATRQKLFLQKELGSSFSAKEFKKYKTYLTAQFLHQAHFHLENFTYSYRKIDKETLDLNLDTLEMLFPQNHRDLVEKNVTSVPVPLVLSLIRQESAFNPRAKSHAGARGLMQLMPRTAKSLNRRIKTNDLFIPEKNIALGVKYIQNLYKKYEGNLIYTLAAYNAGEGNLQKWINSVLSQESILHTIESIPYNETRLYVQLIFRNIYYYQLLSDPEISKKKEIGEESALMNAITFKFP